MRGDGAVGSEERVVGVPKFHSWGKCTMPLTNINSDWMSIAFSGLCINLYYLFILRKLSHIHSQSSNHQNLLSIPRERSLQAI